MRAIGRTTLGLAACAGLGLAGCETVSDVKGWASTMSAGIGTAQGVRVVNRTDRIVRAELLQLRPDGEMTTWSTQTVSPGAEFKEVVDSAEKRPGMRVRFMLADQTLEDNNWVMLNLPEKKHREYNLVLIGTHLSAREMKKGEKPVVSQ